VKLPRFYPIVDMGILRRMEASPVQAAEALIEAGSRILQFRHKGQYDCGTHEQAESIAGMCRDAGVLFVMNDRADAAMLLNCALHVGQDDLPPSDARRLIGTESILGYSTHNEQQFREALWEAVDYIAIGPIFRTSSKENPDPTVGIAELSRLRELSPRPLVAIGGITLRQAEEVWNAGADSIAVIGDLYASGFSHAAIRAAAEEWVKLAHE
jgi:thiamine-phosphate pyrophosphorylase